MPTTCPFCAPASSRICLENEAAIAILDAFPVAEGHTLVVPRRTVAPSSEPCIKTASTLLWDSFPHPPNRPPGILQSVRCPSSNRGLGSSVHRQQPVRASCSPDSPLSFRLPGYRTSARRGSGGISSSRVLGHPCSRSLFRDRCGSCGTGLLALLANKRHQIVGDLPDLSLRCPFPILRASKPTKVASNLYRLIAFGPAINEDCVPRFAVWGNRNCTRLLRANEGDSKLPGCPVFLSKNACSHGTEKELRRFQRPHTWDRISGETRTSSRTEFSSLALCPVLLPALATSTPSFSCSSSGSSSSAVSPMPSFTYITMADARRRRGRLRMPKVPDLNCSSLAG